MSPSPTSSQTRIRPAPVAAETTSGSRAPVRPRPGTVSTSWPAPARGGGGRGGQVLAGLELHRDGGIGSSSSRANAAPYAAAARTPATVTVGYSAVICSAVIPAARQSKITLTGTGSRRSRPGRASLADRRKSTPAAHGSQPQSAPPAAERETLGHPGATIQCHRNSPAVWAESGRGCQLHPRDLATRRPQRPRTVADIRSSPLA